MKNTIQYNQYKEYYINFKTFLKARNYSKINSLLFAVREYLIYLETHHLTDLSAIKQKEMIAYYEYLSTRKNKNREGTLSDNTIKNYLFGIALFYDYLLDSHTIDKCIYLPTFVNTPSPSRTILTEQEIKKLYNVTKNKQERAILSVAYGCGLRRTEIQQLDLQDISLSKGMLIVKKGKKGKRREVPLSDNVLTDLKNFIINERYSLINPKNNKVKSLFINKIGTRMNGQSLNKLLKRIIKRTEDEIIISKSISLHHLRHSIAHHLIERNAGIEFIKEFLGHSIIDTSHLYIIRRKRNQKLYLNR